MEYFEGEFINTYTKALSLGIEIFVLGDLNCDLLKSCREGNTLKDMCETLNLTQLVTTPTRVTPQSSSLIDVILATNTSVVKETIVVENHISDHYLTYIVLNLKIPKPPPTHIITRRFRKYDSSKFLQDLERLPWIENSLIGDVSERVDHFNQHFLCLLNKHAPVKKVKIKHRQCPFVDEQLKQHMRERDQLLKIAKETNSPQEWQTYRAKRNEVKGRLREAEREHVQSQLASCQKNSSKWKVIRNCIPRKESTQAVYSRDVKIIADEFNEFFSTVGSRAAEASASLALTYDLSTVTLPMISDQNMPESEKFHFQAVSENDIKRIVMSFQSNKAPGYDKVPMTVLKDALPCILPTLTDIVNHSLLSSVFPASWKISEVVPLPKDGDLELANNNRPVSLLPAMSKICERAALNQFMAYMKSRKRLTEHQSGNKAQHSTETLNVMMTDKFLEAMNNKMLTFMVLLDLSKAFDSIDHAKLLVKLRSLGVSCAALEWFRSYMHDRQQYTRIGSEMSGMCQSTHGVPQGSILGPALFNVYINDMPGVPNYCSLESYVDDSKLHLSFLVKDIDGAARQITEDLRKVAAWCCQNSLLINPDKTKLLLIGTRQMLQNTPTDLDVHVTLLGERVASGCFSEGSWGVYGRYIEF